MGKIMKNQLKLVVGGIDYYINSDEEPAYLRSLGEELNKRLDEIQTKSSFLSKTMVALFAALEYSDEAHKNRALVDELTQEVKKYIEDAAVTKLESDQARREIERLSGENYNLRREMEANVSKVQPTAQPTAQTTAQPAVVTPSTSASAATVNEPTQIPFPGDEDFSGGNYR